MRCILFDPQHELSELIMFLKDYGFSIFETVTHDGFSDALENRSANIVIATDATAIEDDGYDAEHALRSHKVFMAMQAMKDEKDYFIVSDQENLIDLDFVIKYPRKAITELKAKILHLYQSKLDLARSSANVVFMKKK